LSSADERKSLEGWFPERARATGQPQKGRRSRKRQPHRAKEIETFESQHDGEQRKPAGKMTTLGHKRHKPRICISEAKENKLRKRQEKQTSKGGESLSKNLPAAFHTKTTTP
jgi:hypothetical protein